MRLTNIGAERKGSDRLEACLPSQAGMPDILCAGGAAGVGITDDPIKPNNQKGILITNASFN
jgi:hypothetical protein